MDLALNAYLTALLLGAIHAVEVDHMVAVSVFTGFKPKLKAAIGYGGRWGIGHASVVVVVGALLAWFNIKVPPHVESWGETAVGLALIGLGIWALRRSQKFHAHLPQEHVSIAEAQNSNSDESAHSLAHGHLHAHNHLHAGSGVFTQHHSHHAATHEHHHHHNAHHHHQHLPTAMGALHGLAGSAPVLALVPITLLENFYQALIYLTLFSVGTTLSMMVYAGFAALAMQRLSFSQQRVVGLTKVIAWATVVVGVWWVIRASLFN